MSRYFAVVKFNTVEFEADSEDEAEGRVRELIDELYNSLESEVRIDNADYTMYVEGEGN